MFQLVVFLFFSFFVIFDSGETSSDKFLEDKHKRGTFTLLFTRMLSACSLIVS